MRQYHLRNIDEVTGVGALSFLLPRELADRIEWWPWVTEIPPVAWELVEQPKKLFTGERAALALVLGGWNGTRIKNKPPQILDVLQRMDMGVVSEVIGFIWDSRRMQEWGKRRGVALRGDILTEGILNHHPSQALLFGSHGLSVLDGCRSDEGIMAEAAGRVPVSGAR